MLIYHCKRRDFGSDPDRVIECVRAYIRGIKDAAPHMACTCKHFPGDGWDELDPHISPAHNEAGAEEWLESYGRVYRTMIDEGLETVMTGQISLPAMSRRLRPGIRNEEILPASLAPELLGDLLRGELGFNGLIISDASHMIGMSGVMARSEAVPRCIAAGCDMFLFANDFEEDLGYLKAGYERGIVTEHLRKGLCPTQRGASVLEQRPFHGNALVHRGGAHRGRQFELHQPPGGLRQHPHLRERLRAEPGECARRHREDHGQERLPRHGGRHRVLRALGYPVVKEEHA